MLLACPDCGTAQKIPALRGPGKLLCCRCKNTLEHSTGRGSDVPLACATATLVLLFPANLMPLLSVSLAGVVRSSRLGSGVAGMWTEGWLLLAVVVGLQGIILPFLRFGMLSTVLAAIRFQRQGRWTGKVFRWAEHLDLWAMPDVFLIGAVIGYSRVAAKMPMHIGPGGWCLVSAAALSMLTRASLDRRAVWRSIAAPVPSFSSQSSPAPSSPVPSSPVPSSPGLSPSTRGIACMECDLILPEAMEGRRCPRCEAALYRRRPFSLMRASALVAAGYLFYPVANWFPMSIDIQAGETKTHTIASGVEQLLSAGLWPLALVIFTASIAIPLLKLTGLTWLIWSAKHGSSRRLVLKTKLYRVIREIDRWSNIDVFTIAIFLPLMQFNGLVSVQAAKGAPAFLAVIVLTMLAVHFFDPRLIWDGVPS
jgi:paraquat-inducible protein A